MSQENVETVQWIRANLSRRSEGGSQRRTLDERLLVRIPGAYALFGRFWTRLPLQSRLRRMMLTHGLPRTCAVVNRRDFAVFLLGFHRDVEFRVARGLLGPDQPEVVSGHGGVLEFLQAWFETFEGFRYEPEEVLDLGDRAFVLSHLQRGLVVKQETFMARSNALEAAGLSE